jgi:hypothetical protein
MRKLLSIIIQLVFFVILISCNYKSERKVENNDLIETSDSVDVILSDYEFDWQIDENIKINISDIDIFQNIYELPYPYKDLEEFIYNEMFPLINNRGLCVVENENITIMYQAWGSDYFISMFWIKSRNTIYSLGKYIGVKSNVILNIFDGEIEEDGELQYISYKNKSNNRITFFIENDIISSIHFRKYSDIVI